MSDRVLFAGAIFAAAIALLAAAIAARPYSEAWSNRIGVVAALVWLLGTIAAVHLPG